MKNICSSVRASDAPPPPAAAANAALFLSKSPVCRPYEKKLLSTSYRLRDLAVKAVDKGSCSGNPLLFDRIHSGDLKKFWQ